MKPLRLLIINPIWPHPSHSTRAANIVLFELIREFSSVPGINVGFLKIHQPGEGMPTEPEILGKSVLEEKGVEFLPEFFLKDVSGRPKWRKIFSSTLEDFYPGVTPLMQKRLEESVQKFAPDFVFIPWSEWVTALASRLPYPKYAYYGNPDPKSASARVIFERRHRQIKFYEYAAKRLMVKQLETLHLNIMRRYEMIGDVAANDAEYYRGKGLSNAHYIQNVWFDQYPHWRTFRESREQTRPLKIVGSIGKLSGTANTHGLELLSRYFLPELRKVMGNRPFEIHIFGAGEADPAIAPILREPEFKFRGFVENIDEELLTAPIFLCLNNASDYKVGHTRYLHAWSLGSCVVAHDDVRLSMPELRHRENALLGKNFAEMAALISEAEEKPELRKKMGKNGYDTFRKYFLASHVVPKILRKFEEYDVKVKSQKLKVKDTGKM